MGYSEVVGSVECTRARQMGTKGYLNVSILECLLMDEAKRENAIKVYNAFGFKLDDNIQQLRRRGVKHG